MVALLVFMSDASLVHNDEVHADITSPLGQIRIPVYRQPIPMHYMNHFDIAFNGW